MLNLAEQLRGPEVVCVLIAARAVWLFPDWLTKWKRLRDGDD